MKSIFISATTLAFGVVGFFLGMLCVAALGYTEEPYVFVGAVIGGICFALSGIQIVRAPIERSIAKSNYYWPAALLGAAILMSYVFIRIVFKL